MFSDISKISVIKTDTSFFYEEYSFITKDDYRFSVKYTAYIGTNFYWRRCVQECDVRRNEQNRFSILQVGDTSRYLFNENLKHFPTRHSLVCKVGHIGRNESDFRISRQLIIVAWNPLAQSIHGTIRSK